MWVCLRVEHSGQNIFQAFQKPMYLQKSFDALFFFFLLIQNLAYFKDKEFLIFSRHLYSLFLYEHFPYHLQRGKMSSSRNQELIHTLKSTSKAAGWEKETLKFISSGVADVGLLGSTLAAHSCSGIFLQPYHPIDSYGVQGQVFFPELLSSQVSPIPQWKPSLNFEFKYRNIQLSSLAFILLVLIHCFSILKLF